MLILYRGVIMWFQKIIKKLIKNNIMGDGSCGLRRRGFTPESIRAFADKVGVAKRDMVAPPARPSLQPVQNTAASHVYTFNTGLAPRTLTYFSYENKRKLNNLIDNMSDTDAEKILHKLFDEITQENSEFRLTSDVENALITMILDKDYGTAVIMATHDFIVINRYPSRMLKTELGKVIDSAA